MGESLENGQKELVLGCRLRGFCARFDGLLAEEGLLNLASIEASASLLLAKYYGGHVCLLHIRRYMFI